MDGRMSGWEGEIRTFLALHQVLQAVLCVLVATCVSNAEDWRVVVEHLRVTERCQIRART